MPVALTVATVAQEDLTVIAVPAPIKQQEAMDQASLHRLQVQATAVVNTRTAMLMPLVTLPLCPSPHPNLWLVSQQLLQSRTPHRVMESRHQLEDQRTQAPYLPVHLSAAALRVTARVLQQPSQHPLIQAQLMQFSHQNHLSQLSVA